jgi:hypothetical protein
MTSGVLVYWQHIITSSKVSIKQWCRNCKTDGIVVMTSNGDLLHIDVREDHILNFILKGPECCPDNVKLWADLALQFRTQEGEKVVKGEFMKLFEDRDTTQAAIIARAAPKALLRRNKDIFRMLYQSDAQQVVEFYNSVMVKDKLDTKESHLLGRSLLELNQAEVMQQYFFNDKLTYSDPLGDEILKHNPEMASSLEKEHQLKDYTIKEGVKILSKTANPSKNIGYFLSSVLEQTEDTQLHY